MHPELFVIPWINLSIKSYGVMMVLGFFFALLLARRLARRTGETPTCVTDFAIWVLLSGIIGARLMHVLHNLDYYRAQPGQVFALWSGGLEFLGGVLGAVVVTIAYLWRKKLPILKTLDILAPAVMLGLAFGRFGCFLNGCCFGQACNLPWAIQFPALNEIHATGPGCERQQTLQYSHPYNYQLTPDPDHPHPLTKLPDAYYDGYVDDQGRWVASRNQLLEAERDHFHRFVKPPADLTDTQRRALTAGEFPMHPVHPTQLYSLANALLLALVLTLLFRRYRSEGQIFAAMLLLYGLTRFAIELLRVEPFFVDHLSISQFMGLSAAALGVAMFAWLHRHPRPPRVWVACEPPLQDTPPPENHRAEPNRPKRRQ